MKINFLLNVEMHESRIITGVLMRLLLEIKYNFNNGYENGVALDLSKIFMFPCLLLGAFVQLVEPIPHILFHPHISP